MYKEKYLSYKQKYLNLKKIQEGGATENEKLAIFLEKYGGSGSTDEEFAREHRLVNPLETKKFTFGKYYCEKEKTHKYLKRNEKDRIYQCYKKAPAVEAVKSPAAPNVKDDSLPPPPSEKITLKRVKAEPAVEAEKSPEEAVQEVEGQQAPAPETTPAVESPAAEAVRESPAAEAVREEVRKSPAAEAVREEVRKSPAAETDREEVRESPTAEAVRESSTEDDVLPPPPSINPLKRLKALPAAEEKPKQSGGKFYELEFNKNLINK